MTSWRWRARTPKVRFRNFLRGHLQVVQRMALRNAQTSEHDERIVIGLGLLPPDLLVTIHFRGKSRPLATKWQAEQALVF